MKGNVIQMNTLHLNSVRLNGIGKVQSVSLKGGSTEDPVFPPVEPPVEPEPTPTYTLSASVTNGKVSAKRNGSAVNLPFTANEGDVIIVEVTPNDGYTFEGWNDGNTDNPRSITMTADVVLSAQCVEVVQPPVGNYIQFADAEVERVLMANGVSSDGVGITIEDAEKVTSISTWFKGNTAITSFEEFAYFKNCTSLEKQAFSGCTSLQSISLVNIVSYGEQAFNGCSNLVVEDLNLENATTMGLACFYGTKVKKVSNTGAIVTLGSTTTSSGTSGCFQNCTELIDVTLSEGLQNIGKHCFRDTGISSIVVPNSVKAIGGNAFNSCDNLTMADIGSGCESIGASTFEYCKFIEMVISRASTPPSLGAYAFRNTNSTFIIYVPDASLEAYKTAVNWSAYADRIHPLSEIEDYYIQDALLLHLDGINKGNVDGEWQDLVSGKTFVNHGAIAEADGWRFDGASSYMNSTNMASYGPGYGNRTFEIVAEFDRANTTEVVYMGAGNGYAFGRYAGGKSILLGSNVGLPSLADDMTSGVRIVSAATTTEFQIVASKINGNNAQVGANNHFDGGIDKIYLGSRALGNHFKGKIHSIRIHDRMLSEEEILYNQRIDNKRFNLGLDI